MTVLEFTEPQVTEQEILKRDLTILEAMVAGLPEYLASDATSWELKGGDMPPLTIGGCLMRLNRLTILQNNLTNDDRLALARVRTAFDATLRNTVVRFEQRAYQELNARLREWTNYLRNLSQSNKLMADQGYYAVKVYARIVIGELVGKLSERPYRLDGRVPRDVAALDRRLRLMWQPDGFLLALVWQRAYPPDPCWWLYGHPKGG
jgi:hypothetical protein